MPNSLSCILDSKVQDSGSHRKHLLYSGIRIQFPPRSYQLKYARFTSIPLQLLSFLVADKRKFNQKKQTTKQKKTIFVSLRNTQYYAIVVKKVIPFYRYGGHIELIRFKEYYRMPRGHENISFVFSSAFRDIFS